MSYKTNLNNVNRKQKRDKDGKFIPQKTFEAYDPKVMCGKCEEWVLESELNKHQNNLNECIDTYEKPDFYELERLE